jgi:hypothetical protein
MGIVRISRAFFGWILLVSMAASWTGGATIGICQVAEAQPGPVAGDPQDKEGEKSFESLIQFVFEMDLDVDISTYDHILEDLGAVPRGENDMVKQIPLIQEPLFKNFMVRRFKGKEGAEIIILDGSKNDWVVNKSAAYFFLTNEKAELITCVYKVEGEDVRPVPDEVARERFAEERDWWLEWKQHNKHLLEEGDKDQ